jgi:hypothetical protein
VVRVKVVPQSTYLQLPCHGANRTWFAVWPLEVGCDRCQRLVGATYEVLRCNLLVGNRRLDAICQAPTVRQSGADAESKANRRHLRKGCKNKEGSF